jgi:hypothetical protein
MRRARRLLWILALVALAAGPSYATSVTVLISGVWDDSVIDDLGVTNGAIALGGTYTATLVFDDATPDTDGTSNVGNYQLAAASTDLVISSGGFTFSLPSSASISFGIDDKRGKMPSVSSPTSATTPRAARGGRFDRIVRESSMFDSSEMPTAHDSDSSGCHAMTTPTSSS